MRRVWGFIRFVLLALACYLLFGIAGQLSSLWMLNRFDSTDAVGWAMYGLAITVAVAVPLIGRMWLRSGRTISPVVRVLVAGFTAFFCWQWTVAGVPDWSLIPLIAGFVVCTTAAIVFLRITSSPAGYGTLGD